jgi:undecaprenyl-phosphate 4-deoxy-4-formamido-L-arabinose transferase
MLAQVFSAGLLGIDAYPVEIEVAHEPRQGGETKYPFFSLIMLLFDLVTGFSMIPMRLMTVTGFFIALGGTGFGVYLMIRQ